MLGPSTTRVGGLLHGALLVAVEFRRILPVVEAQDITQSTPVTICGYCNENLAAILGWKQLINTPAHRRRHIALLTAWSRILPVELRIEQGALQNFRRRLWNFRVELPVLVFGPGVEMEMHDGQIRL